MVKIEALRPGPADDKQTGYVQAAMDAVRQWDTRPRAEQRSDGGHHDSHRDIRRVSQVADRLRVLTWYHPRPYSKEPVTMKADRRWLFVALFIVVCPRGPARGRPRAIASSDPDRGRVLAAMVAHDSKKAPRAANVRFTEQTE